jgi:hypothetical protein
MSLSTIEKRDVDLNALFNYTTTLELLLPEGRGTVTLHQRVIGDENNGKAQVHALRKSSEFREKIRNRRWKDRKAYIPNISDLKKDEIVETLVAMMLKDLTLEAINEVHLPTKPEPDEDASLEEQEEYQKYVDLYPELYNMEVTKLVADKRDAKIKEVSKINKDELLKLYETVLIDMHSQAVFEKAYSEMSAYFGTYSDEDFIKRPYKSFEDFLKTPTRVKAEIIKSYKQLELSSVTLKK